MSVMTGRRANRLGRVPVHDGTGRQCVARRAGDCRARTRRAVLPAGFSGQFENLGQGRVYYAFDRTKNAAECRYDPRLPLIWSVDFNVNPMCSVIAQRVGETVYVLDELVLPDSNTPAACEEFLHRTQPWWSRGRRSDPQVSRRRDGRQADERCFAHRLEDHPRLLRFRKRRCSTPRFGWAPRIRR